MPLWEYVHTARLAVVEDSYFAGHLLFEEDARILDAHFTTPGRLVDLGCGAGRHALRFAGRGFSVVAIDLSRPMLQTVQRKALELEEGPSMLPLQA
ncbi:MAG: class I SAM-dependent methyltransferase, partial [Isosphaeraceae bacterium]